MGVVNGGGSERQSERQGERFKHRAFLPFTFPHSSPPSPSPFFAIHTNTQTPTQHQGENSPLYIFRSQMLSSFFFDAVQAYHFHA